MMAAVLFPPERLSAATFNIANGDVVALRNAINTCNTNAQHDTINLAANGTYVLTAIDVSPGSDGATGLPPILRDGNYPNFHHLTINGNNATLRRSTAAGTPLFRILAVTNFSTGIDAELALATLSNIVFENGHAPAGVRGGGVFTAGKVVLNNCTIRNNATESNGGGIANANELVMQNCTVNNNESGLSGGGLHNASGANRVAELFLTNCTLSGNSAVAVRGDAIYNVQESGADYAYVRLRSCTVQGGDLANRGLGSSSQISLFSTILDDAPLDNSGSSFGQIVSSGYNLSSHPDTSILHQIGDQVNTDPKLDPGGLSSNGGPTQTIALTFGSPAIDAGNSASLATDQRGFARRINNPSVPNASDGADVGAFEAAADPMQGGVPSLIVNSLADHNDGVCSGLDCTLREALQRTNTVPQVNAIKFASNLAGVITLNGGELTTLGTVSITGPGARVLAVSGNTQSRILSVLGGAATISGLTFRDGWVYQGPGTSSVGGGIYIETSLTLSDCALMNNRVLGGDGLPLSGQEGGWARGGAIFNGQTLILNRCTFSDGNGAFGGNGGTPVDDGVLRTGGKGGRGLGGAVFNDVNGMLTVDNCTLSGNSGVGGAGANGAPAGGAGGAGGVGVGGIFNQGTMTVTAGTISGNSGSGGAGGQGRVGFPDGAAGKGVGGVRAETGTSIVRNTLLAANTRNQAGGPDVDGICASGGFNLIGVGDFSSGFNQTGDQVGTTAAPVNAMTASLANNGGPTNTIALLNNSPAIDRGKSFLLATDQRGLSRIRDLSPYANATDGDGTDIGAFELDAGVPVSFIVSRKSHGSSGVFDLALPTTGATGIECRSGGAGLNHQLLITFPAPVTVGGLSLVSSDNQATASYSVSGSVVTLNLSAVANAQKLGITLNNVIVGATQGSLPISLGVLFGDVTRNGSVNGSDVGVVKSLAGQAVSATNFASDVTANGASINSSDIGAVKSQSGSQLPAAVAVTPDGSGEE